MTQSTEFHFRNVRSSRVHRPHTHVHTYTHTPLIYIFIYTQSCATPTYTHKDTPYLSQIYIYTHTHTCIHILKKYTLIQMLKRYLETVNTQKKMNCSMTKDAELNLNLSL